MILRITSGLWLIVLLLLQICMVVDVHASQIDLRPVADSYTENYSPDSNFGGANLLYTYNCQYEIAGETYTQLTYSWLKFDISGIPPEATVSSINFRIHTFVVSTPNRVTVLLNNNNSWEELEINWNNMPPLFDSQTLQTVDVASGNLDYDFDLTAALKGKSTVSLVLKTVQSTPLGGSASFYSREGGRPPALIVEYSMPLVPIDASAIIAIGALIVLVLAVLGMYSIERRKPRTPSK